ncbi:Glutaredoxin [Tilletia horrida]|nr:Glutaredoxin [Tilletia horrida]KAK0533392.1 Glutaredoxin [Tilletia horrida]KAK0559268.1 Glutaredoxin [Tilletia horrida]
MPAPKEIAENLIADKKIAVFSKSYCPYCKKAKEIIAKLNLDSEVGIIELDQDSDGADIQAYLADKTGQRTVPNIFIGGKHVGGSSDLVELESKGELKKLVGA